MNVAELLWQAAGHTRSPAVIEGVGAPTAYDELQRRAAGGAAFLAAAGVGDGDRVAIFAERGSAAIAAYFAVLAVGGVAVLVNERLRPRQVEYVLAHSGARLLIASAWLMQNQPRALNVTIRIADLASLPETGTFTPVPRAAGDLCNLVYTSGSSGPPKGVAHTHAGILAGVEIVAGYLGLKATDRTASVLSLSSVYGLNQLLCAVATGGVLVIERSPLPQRIVATLRAAGATVLAAVPGLWLQLLDLPAFRDGGIPSLTVLQNAGEHPPVELVRRVREAYPGAQLFLQYGMTETFRGAYVPPSEVDARPQSIGRAMPRSKLVVVREDLTECAPGEVGQLAHIGPTVAAGYWNDPDGTARVFRPYPFGRDDGAAEPRAVLSGDMARADADGYLYFVGRSDRMIKTMGFRVGPDEIGDVLFASGEVADAVVTSEPDAARGERVVAHVVLNQDGDVGRLRRYCGTELPRYMWPARFELHAALPRLPSGKYDVAAVVSARP
jgi:acyl-CoA synthetase (AMP-forming)/AMP-acid ligase II